MSTLKQIEANRRNATKSTGPRTDAGKAASSCNALQHGVYATSPVILGENGPEFEAFSREYTDRFQPATPEEQSLVSLIVRNAWILERLSHVETDLWNSCLTRLDPTEPNPLAETYLALEATLQHLQRRIDAVNRAFRQNLELLMKLQAERAQPVTKPNGFVPSKTSKPVETPLPAPYLMQPNTLAGRVSIKDSQLP